jgi:hypothetical protein
MADIRQTPVSNYPAYYGAGLLNYINEAASKPFGYENDPVRALTNLLGIPSAVKTLENTAYGMPNVLGTGMATQLRPEAKETMGNLLPMAPAAARLAAKGAVATGKYIAPQLGNMAEQYAVNTGLLSPVIAYHGTPHVFDKFDMSKIGTGEGAQAYSHGLYFAEKPGIASEYQKNLSTGYANKVVSGEIKNPEYRKAKADLLRYERDLLKKYQFEGISPLVEIMYHGESKFPKEVVEKIKQLSGKEEEIYNKLVKGNLYKVDIPDNVVNTFIDWDKPFGQQTDSVKRSLNSLHPEVKNKILAKDVGGNEPTGGLIINRLQEYFSGGRRSNAFTNQANYGAKEASEELNSINIKGAKYLDALSRSADEGTRNFVVYDPETIKMLERNNQPIQGLLK